jgi:uncharacterized protein
MLSFSKHHFINGIALGLAMMAGFHEISEFIEEINYLPPPSSANQSLQFNPVLVDPAWIKSGSPNFRASMFASSPDGKRNSGIWQCDGPSTFEWNFDLDETIYILEGEVEITYLGKIFTLKLGDTAVFHSGTKAIWHVPKHLKKSFTLHQPERLVRLYRKVAAKFL